MKLTAFFVKTTDKPGKYADGGGLYLEISEGGTKSWLFRYQLEGRRREMGLGSAAVVPLALAREKALENRRLLVDDIDPIDRRDQAKQERTRTQSQRTTVAQCLEQFIAHHSGGWSNPKQIQIWRNSFKNHAPELMKLPVAEVTRDHVSRVLQRIWFTKPETGHRLRVRLDRVLGFGKAMGYRTGENPAAWRDNLDHVLPSRAKFLPIEHFNSMNRAELPEFIKTLRSFDGVSYRALEFLILTACRTGEVLGSRWEEFSLENAVWTIPARRMKSRKEHRVALSSQAILLLKEMKRTSRGGFVFPGRSGKTAISNMSMLVVMRRLKRKEVPHGFRSTFKDWASECTEYANEVSEMALAHTVGNKVEAAYRRGDLLEKRRSIMQDWADFCTPRKIADLKSV